MSLITCLLFNEDNVTGIEFLENCLSPDYVETIVDETVEKKLVEHIFGPILIRSRFTHKTNAVQSGDVANQFDFETLEWKETAMVCELRENQFVIEESEKVRDADRSFTHNQDIAGHPDYAGLTKGEQRFKYYSTFNESSTFWDGPYNDRGLDIFIQWYQKAREVVEDEISGFCEGVCVTDGLRAMAGKLADQASSDAVLLHALCAQLCTPACASFLRREFQITQQGYFTN